nr:uncharacterized protein LOC109158743 [Ipomoea batatas]
MNMLSSPMEKQVLIGDSAEEADILRRSKKKTKRGLSEREDADMEIEKDGRSSQMPEWIPLQRSRRDKRVDQRRALRYPSRGCKIADPQPEAAPPEVGGEAPESAPATSTEFSSNPTWKAGENDAGNQGKRGPLGDKYGSWMIANRKPRNYENSEDIRRNNGKNQGGRKENSKEKSGGYQGNKNNNFNKEGFKIWDNSRFGALQNLEDETEDEAQEENNPMDRPNGPTGALLSGRGKRPQTQTTEAQLMNDKSEPRKENNTVKKATSTIREEGRSAEGSKRQGNQAAETESHTVVRGYDKGNKVVRTMITEEGSTMEEVHTQPEGGDHHQDPPDLNSLGASDGPRDPMAGVEFAEGPTSSGLGVVLQSRPVRRCDWVKPATLSCGNDISTKTFRLLETAQSRMSSRW